jgi:transcriptional regulator with XRE-family HTH domain
MQMRRQLIQAGVTGQQLTARLAADLAQCGMRPRQAWRNANEQSQRQAAERFNEIIGDPRSPMTGNRISDFEAWPDGGVRPTMRTLEILARIYGTTWDQLIDTADLLQMPDPVKAAYVELGDVHAHLTSHADEHGNAAMDHGEERGAADAIAAARRALGLQLAALRQAAGYSQQDFAPLAGYGRGTLANVETGRQNVPRAFWERCAQALGAGELVAGYDQIEAMVIADRQEMARRAQAARDARVRVWQQARQLDNTSHAAQLVPLPADRQADEIHIWLASAHGGISCHLVIPRAGASLSTLTVILGRLLESDVSAPGSQEH